MKTPRLAEAFSFAPTRAQLTCRGAIYRVDMDVIHPELEHNAIAFF
jgi:hypothetical protein